MIVKLLYLPQTIGMEEFISKEFVAKLKININENIYLKDPETSALGKKIIAGSIDLIEKNGFEQLTMKKLSTYIRSTEASIYRYFENKHKILLYLTSWYWNWIEYRAELSIINIACAEQRLKRMLAVVTEKVSEDGSFKHINEQKLQKIIFTESSKAIFTKSVEIQNKEGIYSSYKNLVEQISNLILEINPNYKYPHMLISTVIEAANHQRFFAQHLPSLTDTIKNEDSISKFYEEMVLKLIKS